MPLNLTVFNQFYAINKICGQEKEEKTMKHRIKILLLAVLIAALCNCMLMIGMTKTKEKNTIPKDASLICEETVSPNKDYITDEKDLVNYTVRVYQEKNNDIIVYAESNSPLFDEAQYIVICDHAITADDVHIKWTTLMGSTEASEKDEIGLAHVSISKDGEVFNEKTISFVAKAVNAVTDVIG